MIRTVIDYTRLDYINQTRLDYKLFHKASIIDRLESTQELLPSRNALWRWVGRAFHASASATITRACRVPSCASRRSIRACAATCESHVLQQCSTGAPLTYGCTTLGGAQAPTRVQMYITDRQYKRRPYLPQPLKRLSQGTRPRVYRLAMS